MDRETASLTMSTALVGMVFGVYQISMPKTIDARVSPQDDSHVYSSAKKSAWVSAVLVSALSLAAKDPVLFVFGSITNAGLYWWYQAESHVNPLTQGLAKITAAPPQDGPTGIDTNAVYADTIL